MSLSIAVSTPILFLLAKIGNILDIFPHAEGFSAKDLLSTPPSSYLFAPPGARISATRAKTPSLSFQGVYSWIPSLLLIR